MPRVQQFSNLSSVGVLKPCCTTAADRTRVLTGAHPIKPTSTSRLSAWRPNLGRRSTYRCGDFVQTTGASSQHQESVNWIFPSTGLLLIIAALVIGYFEWASWIQVGIAGGIIFVITSLLSSAFPIRTATLVLTTASGAAQALTSRDIAGVEQVKLLIEDAFTARG